MLPMLLCHFYFLNEELSWGKIYENIFNNGGFSVTFFILLSGFVITLGYKENFKQLTKKNYIAFIKSRIRKLYPLYCVTMLYAFFFEIFTGNDISHKSILKLFNALTMTQTLTVEYYDAFNSALWYISCLFVLYLLTPLFLKFLSKIGNCTKAVVLMLVLLYCGVLGQIKLFKLIVENEVFDYRTAFILFYGTPYCRVLPYFIGGGGAAILFEKLYFVKIDTRSATAVEILSILGAAGTYFWGITKERYICVNWLYIPVLLAVIFVFSFQQGRISEFLAEEKNQRLGRFSMYLYMLHYVIINDGGGKFLKCIRTGNEFVNMTIRFIVMVVLVFIISYAVFIYMEKKDCGKRRG